MTSALEFLQSWFFDNPFFGALLVMMCLDVLLGLLLSFQLKRLSSDVSRSGMTRKVVMLVLVLAAEALARSTNIPGARETTSFFFMVSELISVLENAALLGVPIPPVLTAALVQLKATTGAGRPFRPGDKPEEYAQIVIAREAAKNPATPDPIVAVLEAIEKGKPS